MLSDIPQKIFPPKQVEPVTIVITTDACNTGGGFLISIGDPAVHAHRLAWPWRSPVTPDKMGQFELTAIAIALKNSPYENCSVKIVTDSTIAIGALQKGYRASRAVNDARNVKQALIY